MTDYTTPKPSAKKKAAAPKKEDPVEKRVEKVVEGEVKIKQPGLGKKFKSVFFTGDFKTTGQYVLGDVIFPALRNMLADAGKGAIDRAIYGQGTRRPPEYSTGPRQRIRYHTPPTRSRTDPRDRVHLPDQPPHPRPTNRHEASEVIFGSRPEAEKVLEELQLLADQFEAAALGDFYDLVGLESNHTHQKWGWTNLAHATVTQIRDGYLLNLPPLEEI